MSEPDKKTVFRTEKASLRGRLVRGGVRLAFRLMDDPTEQLGMKEPGETKATDAPQGFEFRRRRLANSWLELLRPGDRLKLRRLTYDAGVRPGPPRTVLHLHGGGYMLGLLDPYRYFSLHYLKKTQADLVATLDYRHFPGHHFPAALEDAVDAWRYLLAQGCDPRYIVVAGDSAGANLALGLMLWLRDRGEELPGGAILMSPWADMTFSGESIYTKRYLDPMFGVARGKDLIPDEYARFTDYLGDHDPTDPYISPVFGDFEGFPPMLVQTGGEEMLMSDSLRIVENCVKAGVPVQHSIYEGMFHTFQIIGGEPVPEGKQAWAEAAAAVRGMWDGYDDALVRGAEDKE